MNQSINLSKLKQFLYEYLPAMDETVPTIINRGGCGFFALNLSSILIQMNVPHRILILNDDIDSHLDIISLKSGTKKRHYGIDHCIIEIDGDWFDATGKPAYYMYEKDYKDEVTAEQLKTVVDIHANQWCEVFDIKQEKLIRTYINEIPKIFSSWTRGTYKPTMDTEDNKPNLNSYTKKNLTRMRNYFSWF